MVKKTKEKNRVQLLGALIFILLYTLGIWVNLVSGDMSYVVLWAVLLVINITIIILRWKKTK